MTNGLVTGLPHATRIRLHDMRILNNGLRAGPIVLLLIVLPMLGAASQGVPSHWYRRATSLPTMKMTRAELTQLVDEILPIAKRLEAVDTVIPNPYSHPAEGFMATSIDRKSVV